MEGKVPRNTSDVGDITLTCVDCGASFTFTGGEARYYRAKRLSTPKRCPTCRAKRRATLVPEEVSHG